jgi:hypothetical protein
MRSRRAALSSPPNRPPRAPSLARLELATLPSPFAPGRGVAFARLVVRGDGADDERTVASDFGLRDGDHVALARDALPTEHDLAIVAEPDGSGALSGLVRDGPFLAAAPPAGTTTTRPPPSLAPPRAPLLRARDVRGVVVAVLRRDDGQSPSSNVRTGSATSVSTAPVGTRSSRQAVTASGAFDRKRRPM